MGATTTTPVLTFEEFERLPDIPGKRELLEGELIEIPPAKFSHNFSAETMYNLLREALQAAHSREVAKEPGRVHHEMGYKLSDNSYVEPDVSVTLANQPTQDYLGGAPAIAVEIISPSNTVVEMDLKTQLYFQHGAREVWRVYPKTGHVTVHLPGKSHDIGEDAMLTTSLLPGLSLNVRQPLGD